VIDEGPDFAFVIDLDLPRSLALGVITIAPDQRVLVLAARICADM